jgi:hypothetical protein
MVDISCGTHITGAAVNPMSARLIPASGHSLDRPPKRLSTKRRMSLWLTTWVMLQAQQGEQGQGQGQGDRGSGDKEGRYRWKAQQRCPGCTWKCVVSGTCPATARLPDTSGKTGEPATC